MEEVNVTQMESVCDEAVADKQWTLALQLLRDGASPSERIINELFQNNMAQALLDLFPAGTVNEDLKGLLLMASIRHGLGDFTVRIIQREPVTDSELMEAMKYAVLLLDKPIFLKLISDCPRSRHVFKQKFVHQHWKWKEKLVQSVDSECNGGEVCWLFNTLYEGGEKDLALHVATTSSHEHYLIRKFCWNEINQFDLKHNKFKYALRKLHESDSEDYGELVEALYKMPNTSESDRSFLFCQAIQLEEYNLATSWFRQQNGDSEMLTIDSNCLKQYAVRLAMREYFKQRSDSNLKRFIHLFEQCKDETFTCQVFRMAITESVKSDCVDCFVKLCKKQFGNYASSTPVTEREDCIFAYTSAVTGNRPHFVTHVCEQQIGKQYSALKELQLLLDIVIEKEAWNILPAFSAGLKRLPDYMYIFRFKLLENCVQRMLSVQSTWPGIAPTLDQWIRENDPENMKTTVKSVHKTIVEEHWEVSVSSLKQWSVDTGHVNLAFFLALVTEDWEFVVTVVSTDTSLDLQLRRLRAAVALAAEKGAFSAGVAMLKVCPMNWKSMSTINPSYGRGLLAKACEDQDLLDWAFVLQRGNLAYIRAHHRRCQNPIVQRFILRTSIAHCRWDIARELVTECTDSETLKWVLDKAVCYGQVDIAEAVICRVDPATCVSRYYFGNTTLFFSAVESRCPAEIKTKMVRLCIASGLSIVQRDIGLNFQQNSNTGSRGCPLLKALSSHGLRIIRLMLVSGACSYKRLDEIRRNHEMQDRLIRNGSVAEEWKTCYRCMLDAAATPSRLEHMARLVVSHTIGCQPGRSERIQALPVPELIKDLLRFKDVLSTQEENLEEDERI